MQPRVPSTRVRVLVVDDTVVYRRILQRVVEEIPSAEVVGTANNGRVALERLRTIEVDLVLLDIEMPEMNGIETLAVIRKEWPRIGVVLLSGVDRSAADLTVTALEAGALDFVPKADFGDMDENQRHLVRQLGAIIENVARSRERSQSFGQSVRSRLDPFGQFQNNAAATVGSSIPVRPSSRARARPVRPRFQLLTIGCSTGGPQALAQVIPNLTPELGVPVLVVQHMPPVFTASLAENLDRQSRLRVVEARQGESLLANTVYIAPGGRHMTIQAATRKDWTVSLLDDPPVNSCRPSVDVLFRSAAQVCGSGVLAVILTGMGEDGLEGVRVLKEKGATCLTESSRTCVVYGMPRAVDLAGLSDESIGLADIAPRIGALIRNREADTALG